MNKVYYAEAVYNDKEINAVTKVLKTQRLSLMDGKNVKIFESKISKLFGKKFGLMVNESKIFGFIFLKIKTREKYILKGDSDSDVMLLN
jgi:CDP-6-deoxy-D-xylo-4-hexulose-3-dehydrase